MADSTIRYSGREFAFVISLIVVLSSCILFMIITHTDSLYILFPGWTIVLFLVGYLFVLFFHRHPSHWMMFIATLGNMVLYKGLKIRRAVLYLFFILLGSWIFFYVYLENTIGYLATIFLFIYCLWLGYQFGVYLALKHRKFSE